MDTLLDTSVLISLINDTPLRARFEQHAKANAWRVLVPSAALDELFVGDDPAILTVTAAGIVALGESLGSQFEFAAPQVDIWRAELRGPVASIPVIPRAEWLALLERMRDAIKEEDAARIQSFAGVRSTVRKWKAIRRADSDAIREERAKPKKKFKLTPAQLKATLLKDRTATEDSTWLLQSILKKSCGASGLDAAAILDAPDRCPALKAWLGLTQLAMYAEILPDGFGGNDPFFKLLKFDKNDFFDSTLASVAAYCDQFISSDNGLVARCGFLAERGWIKFRPVAFKDVRM